MGRIGPGIEGSTRRFWLALAVVGLWAGCRPPPLAPLPPMGTCAAPLEAPALGAWTAGPSAPTRRTGGLMMTLTGGRVLFAGGRVGGPDAPCVTDVELFEPATMAWLRLAPLPIAMCGGDGVELDDGRIFVGIQVPGPPSNWRYGEAVFIVYEPLTSLWTEVAHAPAPFNLRHLIALPGDEVFAHGVDAGDFVVGYSVSPRGLVAAAMPERIEERVTVIAGPNRSLTWYFFDGSVMASPTPEAAPTRLTDGGSFNGIYNILELPGRQILAMNEFGWKRWDPDAVAWKDIAPLSEEAVRATPIGPDRVLLVHGGGWHTPASLYTPSSGTSRRIASPHDVDQVFATLPDGRILAVDESGRTALWSADATMDLAWNRLAPIPQLLPGATVTPLADGRLLVAGGTVGDRQTSSRAILVAPDTGAWSETGAMSTPRTNHTATLLPDGRVLVAGGSDYNRIVDPSYTPSRSEPAAGSYDEAVYDLDTLEIWNPTTGAWSRAGRLPVPLTEHSAVALPDGRVAILGGNASRRVPKRMAGGHWGILYATWKFGGVMVWDPSTKRVTDLNAAPRRDSVGALLLRDGRVLALGGVPEGYEPPPLDLLQALDPQAETFTTVGTLRVPRASPLAVQLADGQVLIAGGDPSHLGSKWRSGLPIETWNPTPGASARPLPEFDAPVAPLAARLLRDGRVAIAACDRTILWDPETATWGRSDDLPPNDLNCRIVERKHSLLAITHEGCTYELGASKR